MAMVSDSGNSCMSTLGAEVILTITSMVMAFGVFFLILREFNLAFGARFRRLVKDKSTRVLVPLAFDLFLTLMSYMFGQVKKQGISNARIQLILIWMVLVEIIRMQMDATSTGKLLPVTSYTSKLFASMYQLARIAWVSYLVYTYALLHGLRITLIVLVAFSIACEVISCVAFLFAKGSYLIGKNPELIGNHVKRIVLQGNLQTIPLHHWDYIVMGEEHHEVEASHNGYQIGKKKSQRKWLLTIGRVFDQRFAEQDRTLTSAEPCWRENCLSFALSKMLIRRFVKLPLDEAGSRKALDFVLQGLIGNIGTNRDLQEELPQPQEENLPQEELPQPQEENLPQEELPQQNLPQELPPPRGLQEENLPQEERSRECNPTKRLFRILNDELNLVSAFLHTKAFVHVFSHWFFLFFDLAFFITVLGAMYYILSLRSKFLLFDRKDKHRLCSFQLFNGRDNSVINFDLSITMLLFMACGHLQMIKWLWVYSTCLQTLGNVRTYVQNPAEWKDPGLLKHLFRKPDHINWLKFNETLRQHSVLDIKARCIIPECLWKVINQPKEKGKQTVITTAVKEAVLRSLRTSNGRLTNGKSALITYRMNVRLNWACEPNGSTTEAILVWHIATTLFGRQNPPPEQDDDPFQKEREVVSSLSNYCHYLVASLPELLPDDAKWTKRMYKNLKEEILSFDRSSGHRLSISRRCDGILYALWGENSILGKGAGLAKELMKQAEDQARVWRMLADFWVEIMLFIAPSENIDGHEELLRAKEFITQIWALLTHAGIISRPKPSEIVDNIV